MNPEKRKQQARVAQHKKFVRSRTYSSDIFTISNFEARHVETRHRQATPVKASPPTHTHTFLRFGLASIQAFTTCNYTANFPDHPALQTQCCGQGLQHDLLPSPLLDWSTRCACPTLDRNRRRMKHSAQLIAVKQDLRGNFFQPDVWLGQTPIKTHV
jgi:hypothetical protein